MKETIVGHQVRARLVMDEEVPARLARLLSAHETIITSVRAAREQTAQSGDGGSNDLLTGEVLRTHEQQVWFLAEHLVETPLAPA